MYFTLGAFGHLKKLKVWYTQSGDLMSIRSRETCPRVRKVISPQIMLTAPPLRSRGPHDGANPPWHIESHQG